MPLVRSVRRAHLWLNSRNDSPIRVPPAQSVTASATRASARSRSRSCISRVTRVSRVPNTNDSVRTSFVAGQRLDEPQQQPRVALHRARDVAQDDELARLADLAPPDPLGELAAVARFRRNIARGASRRPCGWSSKRRVRRRSRRGSQQVDEPLGVAQLGRRSSGRSRGGAGPRPWTTRRARSSMPSISPPSSTSVATWMPIVASSVIVALARPRRGLVARRPARPPRARASGDVAARGASWAASGRAGARTARTRGRTPRGRRAGGRTARRRCRGPTALRPMSTPERERPGEVDRRAEVDRTAPPRAAPARSRRPRQQAAPSMSRRRVRAGGRPSGRRQRDGAAGWRSMGPSRRGAATRARRLARLRRGTSRRLAAHLADVLLVLEDDAQRLVDDVRAAARAAPSDSSADAQSSVSATPGTLVRSALAQPVDERDDLAGEPLRARRAPGSRRSRTPWAPSGSRSSGTGSAA